jgi:hypothetical protein
VPGWYKPMNFIAASSLRFESPGDFGYCSWGTSLGVLGHA